MFCFEKQDALSEMLELEAFSRKLEDFYGCLRRKILIKTFFVVATVVFIGVLITRNLCQDPNL
jgi:hypothetical protein